LTGADSEAIQATVTGKARPVLGSGATTMFGFGVLIVSEFLVLEQIRVREAGSRIGRHLPQLELVGQRSVGVRKHHGPGSGG